MTIEQSMRKRVVRILKPLDAVSVENPCCPGTPDVNFVGGWVELKALRAWPVREDTPLRVSTFTNQQRIWAMKRHRAGGFVFLLLQVADDWLLFHGHVVAVVLGTSDHQTLLDHSIKYWEGGLNESELLRCFSKLPKSL